ncbi:MULTISPECIES: aldehyde dehydrogenase [unclassified Romboutsia]|uniref:aldehyde dehydrogenase n=1 Tax=unclassified Romboutsia TaxID=2626894 RepID=UPI0008227B1A|nr:MULTISPECIES: aldehyde dehydrogenase [unclassified Romboutsia]SCG97237.1 Coniferyl aldehyde dehydrogenase [uncultured Clostridium sp.]
MIFNEIDELLDLQNKYFDSQITKDVSFRIKQLDILKKAIKKYESKIIEAIKKDFNKCEFEVYETEIGITLSEIKHVRNKIKKWSSPQKVKTPLTNPGAKTYIYKQPYGVCLIMSPWNYPFYLCISPLIGAIISGNCAIIKPSELSFNTSKVIKDMIEEYFNKEYIAVVEGYIETNKYLLSKKFDYIFFTGSPAVGKIVMEAASKNLTPTTLELGGKSPCVVDKNCDIDKSAKKIVWGKLLNAGQTCIAPDYIIAHTKIKDKLIEAMKKYINEFYGVSPIKSDDYAGIINKKHFNRILNLINYDKVVYGGKYDEIKLKIEPTILDKVELMDDVMQEEIFGPIIPVMEFEKISDLDEIIEKNRNPLAFYVFTNDKNFEDTIINKFSFGGGCVNDTIMHISNQNAPFGGIGNSGIGSYHGKRSFDAFTHEKTILKASSIDIPFKYPPYSKKALELLKKSFDIL